LRRRQRAQSVGNRDALRLRPQYGDFGALKSYHQDECAENLVALALPGRNIACVEIGAVKPVSGLTAVAHLVGLQMIMHERICIAPALSIVALGDADVPEMAALAAATKPGPYAVEGHRLGRFVGLRCGGVLVAMAGERLKPEGFTEIASICTRPECRRRGYASMLVRSIASHIQARGDTPFLHVTASNGAAVATYKSLGFVTRRFMMLTLLAPTST